MAVLLDQTMIRFKPQVVMMPITPMSFLFYTAWAALCLLPRHWSLWGHIGFSIFADDWLIFSRDGIALFPDMCYNIAYY